jgi:glycosyltransferase involved in cell wall biosynthesis
VRILQISSALTFGGGERYVADLANSLHERGHEVYAAVRPRAALIEHLRLPEDSIVTLALRDGLDVQSAQALERLVRKHEIDVIHAHMERDYPLAAYAARSNAKFPETKFIATRHLLFPLSPHNGQALASAHRVIAVSNATARHLRAQRIVSDDRIAIVHNGVDLDRFARVLNGFDRAEFLRSKGLPPDCVLVGSIGELRTLKRHDDFIQAAAIVTQQFPDAYFVLAGVDPSGSGEVRKQLEQLVTQFRLKDRFRFLGWLDDAEQWLGAMDVFVSASETESFGLAIAEAMAAETAVVATKTDGAQEVLEDKKTGLLIEIGNIAQLTVTVSSLIVQPQLQKQLATRAKESVAARFSLQRMVDEIEAIYRA